MRLIELHYKGRGFSINADFITMVGLADEGGCRIWLLGEPNRNPNFCDESYEKVIQLIKEATNEGVPIKKCSAKAFAMCPDKYLCTTLEEAVFMEGSDCEKFNEAADKQPMTNADRIRAMRDEELSEFLCSILSKDRDGCSGCVAEDYCYQGHTGMIDYLKEEYNGKTDI